MQPLPRYTHTHTRCDYMHVLAHKREYPGQKEGGKVRVIVRDFAVDSLIGKQLITGQESRYKILYPTVSPLFSQPFSPYLALRYLPVSPQSSTSLRPLHITVDFSSRTILFLHVFLLSVSVLFRPYMILSFHTWSSFIRLKSVFPWRLPFSPLFTPLRQFFFLYIVLPALPIYLLPFLRSGRPFSAGFPFFLCDAFSFLPTLRTLSHSERVQQGKEWWYA